MRKDSNQNSFLHYEIIKENIKQESKRMEPRNVQFGGVLMGTTWVAVMGPAS